MNVLIVYDSLYGNTKKIAVAIESAFLSRDKVKMRSVNDVKIKDIDGVHLFIVGSPTQGGMPTKAIQAFLASIPDNYLSGIRVAAFDTRLFEREQPFLLRLLIKTIGYASPRIADALVKKGGTLAASPEGFAVRKKEGPLKGGETARAGQWEVIR